MLCPNCHRRLLQKSADGRVRLRTPVLVLESDHVIVACRHCGADVPLDLRPGSELAKALKEPRIVINKIS